MTGNLYWLDPALEEWFGLNERKKLCLCFLGYMALISWFVISIRHTSQCLTRYCLLGKVFNEPNVLRIHYSEGLSHLAVFYLVGAGYLLNLTLRHGMVWYIFSMSIITVNDIMAYMAGFFIGSTPLIVLSPKKTVEGYIGGGLATLVIGPLLAISLQEMTTLTAAWEGTTPLGSEFYSGLLSPFVMHCFAICVFAR